jgi:23S rRNA pseudouridine1911/1915/1917 synthase
MRSSNNYTISTFCVLADPRETRRVDTYLSALFPEKSRSYLQKMIDEEKISCNGATFTKNKKIYRGDIIEISWKVDQMELMAEDMPLDIIFESPDFAIVNKDAGINTHPTPGEGGRRGTLVNALLYHFQTLGVRHERGDGDDENGGEYVDENGEIPTHPSIIN